MFAVATHQYFFVDERNWRDQELGELSMAFGFLLVAARAWAVFAAKRETVASKPLAVPGNRQAL